MNNIQKAFKMKSQLRGMADGGVAQTANTLRGRRAQIDAAVDAAAGLPQQPQPQQQPQQQQPQQQQKPPEKGALRSFFGLADGGYAPPKKSLKNGGAVSGKGGPTADKVGPVALSDGEYVLPADTVDALGVENLDALRLATHKFVDKNKKSTLRGMVDGGAASPYGDILPEDYVRASQNASMASTMANNQPTPEISRQPTPQPAAGPTPDQAYESQIRDNMQRERERIGRDSQRVADGMEQARNRSAPVGPTPDAPAGPGFFSASSSSRAVPDMGARRAAVNSGGGVTGGLLRGQVAYGLASGAADSLKDIGSGYRDEFQNQMGTSGSSPWTKALVDAARVASNIGNATTFGLAGRVGEGIASATGGGSFMDGFTAGNRRDRFLRQNGEGALAPAPAPIASRSEPTKEELDALESLRQRSGVGSTPSGGLSAEQSRWLADNGVPVDQQGQAPVPEDQRRAILRDQRGTPGQYVNLGNYGGDAPIFATASTPGGRLDSFVGIGSGKGGAPVNNGIMGPNIYPPSRESESPLRRAPEVSDRTAEINSRYDALAKELRSKYGPKGQGNLAVRLLQLEQARSAALGQESKNLIDARGQDITAQTARDNASKATESESLRYNQAREDRLAEKEYQRAKDAAAGLRQSEQDELNRAKDTVSITDKVLDTTSAGDKDKKAKQAEVVANLPIKAQEKVDKMQPSSIPTAITSIVNAVEAQTRDQLQGRSAVALGQNAGLGAAAGAAGGVGGFSGKVGAALDAALRVGSRGRYKGSALRDALNNPLIRASLGAAAGAAATPEVKQITDRPNLPIMDENGQLIPASATFPEYFKYGLWDAGLADKKRYRRADESLYIGNPTPSEIANWRQANDLLK